MKTVIHYIYLFMLLVCSVFNSSAQELVVKDFIHLQNDLSARAVSTRRLDSNGNLCALVKVEFAVPDSKFEGYVIGDVANSNSTYWVYMCGKNPASRHMTVAVDGFLPLNIYFSDYGIKSLADGETYKLTISLPEGYSISGSKKTPKHLSVACVKDNERYYFSEKEWDNFDKGQKSEYSILGLTIVDAGHELILALKDASEEAVDWGHPVVEIPTLSPYSTPTEDFEGMLNTSKMLGDALKWGIRYPAASLARDYKAFPGDNTIWYLPSAGELNIIGKNMEELTPLLEKYGGKGFSNSNKDGSWDPVGHWRWTSTVEDNTKYAYALSGTSFKGGGFHRNDMYDKNKVRPVTLASKKVIDSSDKWKQMLTVLCYSKKNNDYFYYNDITLSNMMSEDKSRDLIPVGIVLTDGEHSFILAMQDAIPDKVIWGPPVDVATLQNVTKESEVYKDMDGMANTDAIMRFAKDKNLKYPILDAITNYKAFPEDRISWYIPSSGELLIVDKYKNYINDILTEFNFKKLSDWYWPSTEEKEEISWLVPADYGYLDDQPKDKTTANVRAVASLRLLK